MDCMNNLVVWEVSASSLDVISRGDSIQTEVISKIKDSQLPLWCSGGENITDNDLWIVPPVHD